MEKTLDEKVSLFKSISNSKESLKKAFEDNLLLYYNNSLFKITEIPPVAFQSALTCAEGIVGLLLKLL